jgi:hypothetical protein
MYCIDYLFDFNDYCIDNKVRIKIFLSFMKLYFFRHRMDIDDDLIIVRNILHINMTICLLIAQFLFLFGINQIKYKVKKKLLFKLLFFLFCF